MKRVLAIFISVVVLFPALSAPRAQPGVRHISFDSLRIELTGTKRIQNGMGSYIGSKAGWGHSAIWFGSSFFPLAPSEMRAERFMVAWSDTTEAEKEQVRKKEKKEKKKGQTQTQKDDDDDDGAGSCAVACFGDFFGSLCAGLFDDDDVEGVVASEGYGVTPGAPEIAIPYEAIIQPDNPYAEGVSVWDTPGGREAEAVIVASLAVGAEVTVTESSAHGATRWVRIVTGDTTPTVGWVQEWDLIPSSSTLETVVPGEPPEEHFFDVTQQKWGLLADLSFPVFSEGDINEEYEKNMFSIGAATRVFLAHRFQVGFAFSYTHSNGDPKFDYVVGSITESPSDSELEIWSLGLRFGQLYGVSGQNWFILWEIGPTAFHVSESAKITIVENKVVTGTRTDELSEWTAGGQVKLEIGGILGAFPLSGHIIYSVFPWDAKGEKSLTFDFLEKDRVDYFAFGITVGYSFF
jgi:hypothetical protein